MKLKEIKCVCWFDIDYFLEDIKGIEGWFVIWMEEVFGISVGIFIIFILVSLEKFGVLCVD